MCVLFLDIWIWRNWILDIKICIFFIKNSIFDIKNSWYSWILEIEFLISRNIYYFLISRNRILDIKKSISWYQEFYFLISRNRFLDIKKYFLISKNISWYQEFIFEGPSTRPIVLSMIHGSYCRRRRRLIIFEPDEMKFGVSLTLLSKLDHHRRQGERFILTYSWNEISPNFDSSSEYDLRKGWVRISPLYAPILTFILPSFRRYICTLLFLLLELMYIWPIGTFSIPISNFAA